MPETGQIPTLREYLSKGKIFIIPNYQRGYVWGKSRSNESDSVTYLITNLIQSFGFRSEVFLQGITVCESGDNIEIIDGQQRTTALYLLLCYLGYGGRFDIDYTIRAKSGDFLRDLWETRGDRSKLSEKCVRNDDEEYQDIFFFKKSIRVIHRLLKDYSDEQIESFKNYLLDRVKFLYITISPEQATKIFTMMNGNKAQMLTEEIIKAEILRLVSIEKCPTEEDKLEEHHAREWDKNLLRSKYAREWDKWVYWWNHEEVQKFFGCNNVMGLLVSTYYKMKSNAKRDFTFDTFRDLCLRNGESKAGPAKKTFDGLRRLQKRFEDAFNEPCSYNKIGAIINIHQLTDSAAFIRYFFTGEKKNLDEYYKYVFLGMSHDKIVKLIEGGSDEAKKDFWEKYDNNLSALSGDNLYNGDYAAAYRLLLFRNVEQDNTLNRKFDFSISADRSLEHILPKSKVFFIGKDGKRYKKNGEAGEAFNGGGFNSADFDNCSEHCIGNLVLLYQDENSAFSNKDFEEKKKMYFEKHSFKSRHLIHTVTIFATSLWGPDQIKENKERVIEEFKNRYNNGIHQ